MRIDHGLLPGHVLQRTPRGARATITGICTASGPVTATVRHGSKLLVRARRVGEARDGRFQAVIAGLPAGGPYVVELACAKERVAVDSVFVGDLWLMAGQSNMEGVGNLAAAPEPHPLVRCFGMDRVWRQGRDPLHQLYASADAVHWKCCDLSLARKRPFTPQEADAEARRQAKGVGIGVFFGKLMHERSGVPQGLIATAHGGTSMAEWDPALCDRGGDSLYGSLWLSVLAVGQPLAGVLWYQGCSDATAQLVDGYTPRMQALVAGLRRDLRQPRLPWIAVQIARVVNDTQDGPSWNRLQEQQRLLPQVIPHLDVVPAVDLELDDGIHIGSKGNALLAARMASAAGRLVLRDRRERPAIQPLSARLLPLGRDRNLAVEVRFANVVGGLESAGLPRGFSVLDEAGRVLQLIHKTELDGERARLLLTCRVTGPLQVCYGRGTDPVCTIYDRRGMGLPVFTAMPVEMPAGLSPWFRRWRVTPLQPGEDIGALPRPPADDARAQERSFEPIFADMHAEWLGRSGHAAFHSEVGIPADMEVEVRTGYDGPFRLWIGEREVHTDLAGSNPALPDDRLARVRLERGRHPVTVLMALNGGRAWGFYLRLRRLGIPAGKTASEPMPW
jgi:hypothetical protein